MDEIIGCWILTVPCFMIRSANLTHAPYLLFALMASRRGFNASSSSALLWSASIWFTASALFLSYVWHFDTFLPVSPLWGLGHNRGEWIISWGVCGSHLACFIASAVRARLAGRSSGRGWLQEDFWGVVGRHGRLWVGAVYIILLVHGMGLMQVKIPPVLIAWSRAKA
jgi:hypothetical protein